MYGLYKLVVPVKYISDNANERDKEFYESFKKLFDECMEGKRKGMVFPALTDSDGNYLFDLQYVGPSAVTINNFNSPPQTK